MKFPFQRLRLAVDGHTVDVDFGVITHTVRFDGSQVPTVGATAENRWEVAVDREGESKVLYAIEHNRPLMGAQWLTIRRDGQVILELA